MLNRCLKGRNGQALDRHGRIRANVTGDGGKVGDKIATGSQLECGQAMILCMLIWLVQCLVQQLVVVLQSLLSQVIICLDAMGQPISLSSVMLFVNHVESRIGLLLKHGAVVTIEQHRMRDVLPLIASIVWFSSLSHSGIDVESEDAFLQQ